jgi:HEPN domain-containing protein
MAKAEFLKERAEGFLENARENLEKGRYYLAAFNLEQASQLYLKYYLFLKIADFPRTHSLRELLEDIGKTYNKEENIKTFLKERALAIADLEGAYLSSRYLPSVFNKEQIERMKQFVEELSDFLRNL